MNNHKLKDIAYSVLDLAMVLDKHTVADSFENSVALAQHTETLGYKRYWFAEHHNMEGVASSATSVLIGHIAGKTHTMRIGSGGIMLPNHAPLQIAEQFGTLETLYPGRIDLGLGRAPGTDQLTAHALNRDPKAAMDFPQNVQLLQRYFSSQNRHAPVRAIPGEGLEIPLWILGSSTDSAYLAAELGLPYAFASHFAPAQLMHALTIYRNNFKPSSVLAKPYVIACVSAILADTDEEANLLASSFKRLYIGIITGQREKLKPPIAELLENMHPEVIHALEQMTKYSFVGSSETVKTKLETFAQTTGVNEIMFTGPIYDQVLRLKSYKKLSQLFN